MNGIIFSGIVGIIVGAVFSILAGNDIAWYGGLFALVSFLTIIGGMMVA